MKQPYGRMSTKRGPLIGVGWVIQGCVGHARVGCVILEWGGVCHGGVGCGGSCMNGVCHGWVGWGVSWMGGVGHGGVGWGGVCHGGVGWGVNNFICHKLGFLSFLLTNYYQLLYG